MESREKFKRQEDGQAIFELLIFLPFLIFMLTSLHSIGNAINGSINQQKSTRGYFYFGHRGDSKLPTNPKLINHSILTVRTFGFAAIGWREKPGAGAGSDTSFATCYQITTPLGKQSNATCDEPKISESTAEFIRVYTFYGVCSADYSKMTNSSNFQPFFYSTGNDTICANIE